MKNVGTLISAAIRPNDSNDLIASAFANEIKGGHHGYATIVERNSIINERREWGMLCSVYNDTDTSKNGVYQLTYAYQNINIDNNSNWVLFAGGVGNSITSDWMNSVISLLTIEPSTPNNGDRYLLGVDSSVILSGTNWVSKVGGVVAQWNDDISNWDYSEPKNGYSIRVNDDDNFIYRYEGSYSSGKWYKESLNSIKSIVPITTNGLSFSCLSNPSFSELNNEILFVAAFGQSNLGTASLNINGFGHYPIKKATEHGLVELKPNDINPNILYQITYNSGTFQLYKPVNSELFNNKYIIESNEYIYVPTNTQYWIYGDITNRGILENDGEVVIANGNLKLSGGTYSGSGNLRLIELEVGLTFSDTDTIYWNIEKSVFAMTASAFVKHNSLTASNLNTGSNGGATAGYILSVDNLGEFKWLYNSSTSLYWGINDKDVILISDVYGDNQTTGIAISNDLVSGSYLNVSVNGLEYIVGDGVKTKAFYFSDDLGVSAKVYSNVKSGDVLYFNQSYAGHELLNGWNISIKYSK